MPVLVTKLKVLALTNAFPILLVLICSVISYLNYTPGTWQTGWDTLHPEFNFGINIPRHIFGMWQENQGLGNVGGHSHAADAPRILLLYLASFFLPATFLRYFFLFLTFILGPLGVYYLIDRIILKHNQNEAHRKSAAFLGSLFYIFNLGAVQQFIVPLEMYTTLYGFAPWVFFFALRSLEEGKKHYLKFVVVLVLAAPIAYAITVYIGLYLCLTIFLGAVLFGLMRQGDKGALKRFAVVNLLILLVNAFWLFPSLYFGLMHAKEVSNSRINRNFSQEIFLNNVKYGNLKDLLTLKGFLINWTNYDFENKTFVPTMAGWSDHLWNNKDFYYLEYLFMAMIVVGGLYAVVARNKYAPALLLTFLLAAFMFLTINPPLGWLFQLVRYLLPAFGEIFRNPYTKFSVELLLIYSVLSSFFFILLFQALTYLSFIKRDRTVYMILFPLFLLFSYYMAPMYRGNLVNRDVRIEIPNQYFELFEYLEQSEDGRRVATLPIHSYVGWDYYDWGYQGAGFLWFGARQAFLARDFDRWNQFNEEYYNDMSSAVYSGKTEELERVVRKYGIGHVVLDESVISTATSNPKATFVQQTKEALSKSTFLKHQASFGNIHVYHALDGRTNEFYAVGEGSPVTVTYPFQQTVRSSKGSERQLAVSGDSVVFEHNVQGLPEGTYDLTYADFLASEDFIPVSIYAKYEGDAIKVKIQANIPNIYVNSNQVLNGEDYFKEVSFSTSVLGGAILGVNDKFYVQIHALGPEYTKFGDALLNLKAPNTVSVYTGNPREIDILSGTPTSCSDTEKSDAFFGNGYLSLISREETSCVEENLGLGGGHYLFKTDLTYSSELKTKPSYCIDFQTGCASNLSLNQVGSQESVNISDYVSGVVQSSTTFKLFSPVDWSAGFSKVDFTRVQLIVYPRTSSAVINFEDLVMPQNFRFEVTNGQVDVKALVDARNLTYAVSGQNLYELTSLPEVNEASQMKDFANGLHLKTRDFSVYDSIDFKDIPAGSSYLALFEAQNISGTPIITNISDLDNGRTFVREQFQNEKEVFTLLAQATREDNNGYQVGLINSSIGKIVSENIVTSIKLIPYNGNWLQKTSLVKVGEAKSEVYHPKVQKLAPFLYKVSGLNPGSTLVFEQSFEKGWYSTGHNGHFKVEGWANGWVVGSPSTFVIFLPAILQILGYFMLLYAFIWAFFSLRSKPSRPKITHTL